jgi:general secretion pathway protein G
MTKLRKLQKKKGFTLVELLVIVAILAILAITLLPRFLPYSEQARAVTVSKDIRTFNNIVEIWASENGDYPTPSLDLNEEDSIASVMQAHGINWTGDEDGVKDPWGNPYTYDVVVIE